MADKAGELPPTYQEARYNQPQPQYLQPQQQYGLYGQQQHTVVTTAPTRGYVTVQNPDDHMMRAVIATIFCCWPIGIIAIMRSSEARSAYNRGDMVAATASAQSARSLSNIAIGMGTAMHVVWIVVVIIYVAVILSL